MFGNYDAFLKLFWVIFIFDNLEQVALLVSGSRWSPSTVPSVTACLSPSLHAKHLSEYLKGYFHFVGLVCLVERDLKGKVADSGKWIPQPNHFSITSVSLWTWKIPQTWIFQEFRNVWMHYLYVSIVHVCVCICRLGLEWEVRYLSQLLSNSFWYRLSCWTSSSQLK